MRETRTHWTCNGCGSAAETPTDKQPEGWVGYGFTRPGVPDESVSEAAGAVLGHLCKDCTREVNRALEQNVVPLT